MREILFRGYSKDEEKWVYGCLTLNYTIIDKCGDEWQVEPSSIGQYTGYRDIDGNKIFEGDVLYLDGSYFTIEDMRAVSGDKAVRATIAAHNYKVD